MSIGKKRRSTGRVTLADVAQLAGVGTMTVSRALRTPEQVSDKLREKIEAAVSELGYLPNLAASSLASASSYTIAMVVPSLSESGCAEMFAGLQKVLQPAGYHIMLAESQHHLEREEKLLETLLSYNLAAAVLLSVEHSQNARNALIAANIPVVGAQLGFQLINVDDVADHHQLLGRYAGAVGDVFRHHEHVGGAGGSGRQIGVFDFGLHPHLFQHFFNVHFHHKTAAETGTANRHDFHNIHLLNLACRVAPPVIFPALLALIVFLVIKR